MVKIVQIDSKSPTYSAIKEVVRVIKKGGIVVYPTDTIYGLGADALSESAVLKVFKAKSRPIGKPISVAVDSFRMAKSIGRIKHEVEPIFRELLPGPLTIIVGAKPSLPKLVTAGTGKVGIRMLDHPVALKIIRELDRPLTATSANISGEPSPIRPQESVEQLGERVDIIVDSGKTPLQSHSTVLDATDKLKIVREGPISLKSIKTIMNLS